MRRPVLPTAVLLTTMLVACSDGVAKTSPTSSTAPSVQQSDTPSTTGSPTQQASPNYTDLSAMGEDKLEAGRYAFFAYGVDDEAPVPVIEVPKGFQAFRGFSVAGVEGRGFRGLMAWTVAHVYRNPCTPASAEEVGPRARDLVDALAQQKLTATTKPEPIRLAGHPGIYVEVIAPSGDAFAQCQDSFNLWRNGEGDRFLQAPGQVDRLWILDTPGERLVLDATHTPGVSRQLVRQLTAMVRSTRFLPPA